MLILEIIIESCIKVIKRGRIIIEDFFLNPIRLPCITAIIPVTIKVPPTSSSTLSNNNPFKERIAESIFNVDRIIQRMRVWAIILKICLIICFISL